eukprot:CAMPEP_0204900814 /NCGR_PEP_ID=MMETSP1397-20131031/2699_1 /ASSEMBLY_ACC=CAM_ASM_000891 /TAXON_ID=49980 /ORGANISM="Climacostomum Climacostomum virens, Strain Stock W-24" /LENGTH=228 /DNA_ID=CAMNT_0052069037 /DNA_START=99 /DNA_END=782 /DNA_ORIENTATION=-
MLAGQPTQASKVWSRLLASAVISAVAGVIISFLVNATLAEISINPFFSIYFGLLFTGVGTAIIWKTNKQAGLEETRKKLMLGFGGLVVFAGLICFILEKNWFSSLTPASKVPLYAILGVAVCFALSVAFVDTINLCAGLICTNADAVVETPKQVYIVIATSLVMGLTFGLVFGLLDVEDEADFRLKQALLDDESYCYSIGLLLGAICGFLVEYFRESFAYVQAQSSFE